MGKRYGGFASGGRTGAGFGAYFWSVNFGAWKRKFGAWNWSKIWKRKFWSKIWSKIWSGSGGGLEQERSFALEAAGNWSKITGARFGSAARNLERGTGAR
jgi:hypothetical protein